MEARKAAGRGAVQTGCHQSAKAGVEGWASIAHSIDPTAIENAGLSQSHAIIARAGLLRTSDFEARSSCTFFVLEAVISKCPVRAYS